jgi:hypothetical protein
MVIEYSLVALVMALVYGLIKNFLPDFPIDSPTFYTFVIYVLVKLGVEIVGQPVRSFLMRKMPYLFGAKPVKKAK